jgi:hypothetical protein
MIAENFMPQSASQPGKPEKTEMSDKSGLR